MCRQLSRTGELSGAGCMQAQFVDAQLAAYIPTDILASSSGFSAEMDLNDVMGSRHSGLDDAWCETCHAQALEDTCAGTSCSTSLSTQH